MEQEKFNKLVQDFFEALRQKTLLIILDNIGNKLRGKGIELPDNFYSAIQYQACI